MKLFAELLLIGIQLYALITSSFGNYVIMPCAAFSSVNFIFFYLASLFTAVIGFTIYKLFSRSAGKEIPLAGIISFVLILCFLYKYMDPAFSFYDDSRLTAFITQWTNRIT